MGGYQWMVATSLADVCCTIVQKAAEVCKQKVCDAMRAQVLVVAHPDGEEMRHICVASLF